MRDKPILYSAPMVRAEREDRKTQTRRMLKQLKRFGAVTEFGRSDTPGYDWHFRDKEMRWNDLRHEQLLKVLPFAVGDRLWVRETLRRKGHEWTYEADGSLVRLQAGDPRIAEMIDWARHKAGDACVAIHMPRWASRLTNIVTDVRVQRLQEISEEDALAEGVTKIGSRWEVDGIVATPLSAADAYRSLWNYINGAGSWDANPWIVALTFTVAKQNIDALKEAA